MNTLNNESEPISDAHPFIGKIDPVYVKSQLLLTLLIMIGTDISLVLMVSWPVASGIQSEMGSLPSWYWTVNWTSLLALTIITLILTYIFARMYVKNFTYEISEKFIILRYGVLWRNRATIPFSRIQNITVQQTVRDRWLKIYTIKIETAGYSAGAQGKGRPEGFIPGLRDPSRIEAIINKLVHQYTQEVSEPLKGKVFLDNNVAFDEFVAYILSKMTEKDQIRTTIASLRESRHISMGELAEKLGISVQTVNQLEVGNFLPSLPLALQIARFFQVPLEKIFQLTA
jgi:DNA-binding XRE family transcriptional regulator/membrane protein YdbS with pleckstrin-like domain